MMNKDAKIYVAGHAGLVGSAVLRRFNASGYHNIVVRDFAALDLRRQADVESFFAAEQPEYVVLAAAKVGGILANSTYKAEFIYDNLMIASNIIHSAYKYKVKRLINLGSSCIYPKNAPQPLKEEYLLTGPLEETNEPYAIAKIAAIKLCRYYNQQYGTQFISLMPTNLYGPNDNYNLETSHVIPALIRKFRLAALLQEGDFEAIVDDLKKTPLGWGLEKEMHNTNDVVNVLAKVGIYPDKIELWGSGEVYREFMHVDDLAVAIEFFLQTSTDAISHEIINIGTGVDILIKDLAASIASITNFRGTIQFLKHNLSGTYKKKLNLSLKTIFPWQSKVSLNDGLISSYYDYISHIKDCSNDYQKFVSTNPS